MVARHLGNEPPVLVEKFFLKHLGQHWPLRREHPLLPQKLTVLAHFWKPQHLLTQRPLPRLNYRQRRQGYQQSSKVPRLLPRRRSPVGEKMPVKPSLALIVPCMAKERSVQPSPKRLEDEDALVLP